MQFIDGFSGTSLIRPGLERLRDNASTGLIEKIYVLSPDRLARKYAYQVLLIDELKNSGIEIIFINHEIGRTPEGELLFQMQGMIFRI
jgi:site-specific DNA recombinase